MVFLLVQLATVFVFAGRAWQHLYWDAPYRTLLWDEKWMAGIIEFLFSMKWEEYITDMGVNDTIQWSIKITGLLYLICFLVALFIKKLPRTITLLLALGGAFLVFLAFLYSKERFFSIGQFFEYSLQFGSPFFLLALMQGGQPTQKLLFWMKIAVAATFTCHGLYAIGYYPIPGNFLQMTMNILYVSEEQARLFLKIAGTLDFLLSVGIFLPAKYARPFLLYAALWGLATALARVWANFNMEWLDYVLLQWLHETVMRLPHFLIPLAVLVGINYKTPKTAESTT